MQWKVALLCAYLVVTGCGYALRFLNLRHLKKHGSVVPGGFEDALDEELLRRTAAYTIEQSRVGLAQSLFDNVLLLAFIFGGVITLYDRWIGSVTSAFIPNTLVYFIVLSLLLAIADLPFGLYGTFVVEARYGFNRMSLGLWFSDLFKSTLLTLVFLVILGSGGLWLVAWSPGHWWAWVWGFFALASIFIMYVSPYLIEPLFNKFEPVRNTELESEIVTLMERAGLKVSRVMQVDASRRSGHSNAYFTGIGRVKRIVLYDTLLQQMSNAEVVAILAHEVGHWKKGHVAKRLFGTEAIALAACFLAHLMIGRDLLPEIFGLSSASFGAQLILLAFLGSMAGFLLTPLGSWMSRRHEWEADTYAADLSGRPDALATALVKLSRENLANLHPHPLYAWFYYSHPPVVDRVDRLLGKCRSGRCGGGG